MNIVKQLRKKKGIQQKELATVIGVAQPTVSEWELGKKDPSGERLKKLAEYFNVDELDILGMIPASGYVYKGDDGKYYRITTDKVQVKRDAVPIVGEIACGVPITAQQNIEGYADLPDGVHADFALKCKGDSMTPTFLDGDLVLIRQQPEVEDGQIAAVGINGEATLKHFYRHENGILCVSDNPKYAPQFFPEESVPIVYGLAVGFVRML